MSWAKKIQKILLCAFACVALTFGTTTMANAACSADQIDVTGNGTQCETAKFSVDTTSISSGDTFKFAMSAQGTFYVDCGADGTLSSSANDVSGKTVTRSNTTEATYTCTYSTTGTKTIRFGGTVTGYSTSEKVAALSFSSNKGSASLVSGISGSLGALFPTLGQSNGQKPSFYDMFCDCTKITSIPTGFFNGVTAVANYGFAWTFQNTSITSIPSDLFGTVAGGSTYMFYGTFYDCKSLTTIPSGLFSNITTGASFMFYYTFRGCTSLTTIPSGLFSNITTGALAMFNYTFYGCTKLTTIPSDLFSGITTGASNMFSHTFEGCKSLTTIPSGLFSGITTGAEYMFNYTFYRCTSLTTIPSNLFSGITTGAQGMFGGTFRGCTSLTTIPSDLFSGITTGADDMFSYTFEGCTKLTTIPSGLFSNITTGASYMFERTFYGCTKLTTIPSGLFSGITPGATYMFKGTFEGCTSLTTIPPNLFSGITTGASYMFSGTFQGCTSLTTIPSGLFSGITTGAQNMFASTFYGCTSLTTIPSDLFSGITTGADNMFSYTFYGCRNLSGYIPSSTFAGLIANNHPTTSNMWNNTFNNTQLATSCPSGTTQYITGYEGSTNGSTWNGKVSCTEPLEITLDSTGATTNVSPSTVYIKYNTGWYSDSAGTTSIAAVTAPTKTDYDFMGFYTGQNGTGVQVIDSAGQFITSPTVLKQFLSAATVYAYFKQWPAVTLSAPTADTGVSPSTVYLKYNTGWYADSAATTAISSVTAPTKTKSAFAGFFTEQNGAGTKIVDESGNLLTTSSVLTFTTEPVTLYAYFVGAYDVTYSCGAGTGTPPSADIAVANLSFTPSGAGECAKSGSSFAGWAVSNSDDVRTGAFTWEYTENKTFTAQWNESSFSVTTVEIDDNATFSFHMSAAGIFTVDWGDGTSETLNRTNNTTNTKYSHTYATGGEYTISFAGTATGYSTSNTTGVLSFRDGTPKLVASVTGSLGDVFPTLGAANGLTPRFFGLFRGCTKLRWIPETLFSGVTGVAPYMFGDTFYGCTDLRNIPDGLFSGISGSAEGLFYETFYNCKELHSSIPGDLFAGIDGPARYMFYRTFYNTRNIQGYIPPSLFDGLHHGDAAYMMTSIFYNSALATDCEEYDPDLRQFITGYEEYFDDRVSCFDGNALYEITLDSAGATTSAMPGTVYVQYDNDWFADANGNDTIGSLTRLPVRNNYTFGGFYTGPNGTGTQIVNANGEFQYGQSELTAFGADGTIYAYWTPVPVVSAPTFAVTTTNLDAGDEFRFGMSAAGVFTVDWGDGTVETIDRTNNTEYELYSHTYTTAGVKTIKFAGTATGYSADSYDTAITFGQSEDGFFDETTPEYVASVSGSLGALFPELGNNDNQKPRFYATFYGTSNLTSIPSGLFSGLTGGPRMFAETFMYSGLESIPSGLFSGITTGATGMFYQTFYGCTKLTTIPSDLFSGITTGAQGMFVGTFYGCTSLTTIPSNLFSGITTGAIEMFDGTFSGCENISGYISPALFRGLINNGSPYESNMFNKTFYNTALTDDCGEYGLSEYETGYEQYWDGHVACGNLYTTCPAGKFMHPDTGVCTACPTGSYNDGTVEEECIPCPWGTTTSGPGQSMCNAECHNNIGVLYYKRPEWDYDEYTVNNVCTISSCSGGYYPVINDTGNMCVSCAETTGGTYTHSPTSGVSVYNLDEKYGGDGRRACFLYRSEINGSYIKNPGDMMASECPAGFYNNYPGIDPDEEEPDYNIVSGQAIHFGEAYDCEVCPINTYSIGGATQCTSCLQNYATFGERNSPASCRIMCAGGYYLKDANDLECTAVGAGNWAVSGFVSQGSVSTYQSCPVGLTNIGYGVGADEEGDCGRILHVGDNIMYLRTDRKTEHTLNVKVGNTIFYGNMAAADVNMSYGVNKSLKVRFDNTTYSVYDDSGETYIAEPEVSIQLDPNPDAKTIVPSQYNSASGMDWSAVMSDADKTELSGVGACSTTTGANGAIGAIDFEPNGNGTQCWCKITDPVEATRWVAATANASCSEKCGYYCANNMKGSKAKNITYRTNLYSAAGILKQ